jgi:hypothetical protein
MMQNGTLSTGSARKLVESKWVKDTLSKAKELAEEMCVPSELSKIRDRKNCQLSSYE